MLYLPRVRPDGRADTSCVLALPSHVRGVPETTAVVGVPSAIVRITLLCASLAHAVVIF